MPVSDHQFCLSIEKNTTITLRSMDTGDEFSAVYTVDLQTKNVTVNGEEFAEGMTWCERNSEPINNFEAIIDLGTSSTIGATNVAHFKFRIALTADPVVGTTYTIEADNDGLTGVEIQGADVDTRPLFVADYVSDSTHACTVVFTDFEKGRKAAGTVACSLTPGPLANSSALGTAVTIPTTEWLCDRWGYDV